MMENNDFLITKSENKKSSEMEGYYYYAIGACLFGLVSFHPKFIKHSSPTGEFDPNSFMLYRSIVQIGLAYYISQKTNVPIVRLNEITNPYWFFVRTFVNYICFLSYILCSLYLRAATASGLLSLCPVVAVIASVLFLKEKYYQRYTIGLIICTIGTLMIVTNEKVAEKTAEEFVEAPHTENLHFYIGVFFGLIALTTEGLIIVSMKVLSVLNMTLESQSFHIGLSNGLCAIIFSIFTLTLNVDPYLIIMGFINGLLFYLTNYFSIKAMKLISVAKTSGLNYLAVLVVFFLGLVILGEPLYFTDFIGSLLVLSVNCYDAIYPVEDAVEQTAH